MPRNSLMDIHEALELAPKAIEKVAHIAAALGSERKERTVCGRLGGELLIVAYHLMSAEPKEDRQLRNVRKLLKDIEWICSEIAQAIPGTRSYDQAKKKILAGLLAITAGKGEEAEKAILHIKRFGAAEKPKTDELSAIPKSTPAEYPNEATILAYDVLQKYMYCTCTIEAAEMPPEKRHLTKLLLQPEPLPDRAGNVHFDMLFSSAPLSSKPTFGRWQDVQLLVPRVQQPPKRPKKKVRFGDSNDDPTDFQVQRIVEEVSHGGFCELICQYGNARLCLTILNRKLQLLPCKPPEQVVENTPSISLATVLRNYHLTAKMKAWLAYILAQSVWQFYDSDWMKTRWTSETIQFMSEYSSPPCKDKTNVFASKPYISVRFGDNDPDACESSSTFNELHRHPRVRALGIMLVEIGIGSPLPRAEEDYDDQSEIGKINADWLRARQYSDLEKPWPNFDYSKYRTAVKSCLDQDIFATSPFMPNASSKELADGLKKRRKTLYDCVVLPLEQLLQGTGWKDELQNIGPLQSHTRPLPVEPASYTPNQRSFQRLAVRPTEALTHLPSRSIPRAFLQDEAISSPRGTGGMPNPIDMEESALLGDGEGIGINTDRRRYEKTRKWMKDFKNLCMELDIGLSGERLRVAILDSGIDYCHSDLYKDSRIKDMVSWVDEEPGVDTCGHGTHIAGIILSLTENVEIYVGKITKSRNFTDKEPIAKKAIKHARTNWKVDMISLSFGFEESIKSIEDEITQCIFSSIAVFAAASNDGVDGDRTYPAKYEGVLCIHAATGEGNKATFNPNPLGKEDNFMVVGDCIKSSWPGRNSNGTCAKKQQSGTSFATPVAVCTAAIMIDYIRKNMPDHTAWRISPKSRQGVRAIFRLMAKNSDGYDWVSPRGYFKKLEAAIHGEIRGALQR
ncbi:hypothetical protein CDV31_012691 [Fusarium ambrosium]|uniref:Uncharacterized protein n=1 Tax=Fusarium ambrosium TaxID=131363 RepID=A0A428T842_9HYPO|nr:hypothetical protein CDV31_012691 [Fusarium ambrosium]